ncbi:unnamed protein product [Alopecurus aequalis]
MGNGRSGEAPRGAPESSSSSSTGRDAPGASAAPRAPGGPATPALAARTEAVTAAPRLPPVRVPGPGSSGRERGSTGPGNPMRPPSVRQQNGAAEEARLGASSVLHSSASSSLSRDSDRSGGGSTKGEEETTASENASGASKKRKRMTARSYLKKFKMAQGPNPADVVVASPDRVGKENTSSGHLTERHSSDAASKVSKSPVFGLLETSETRINQCSTPFSEVQPRKPTDVCQQNIASESSLPVKARDRPTAPARQSSLSSLQSAPTSLLHHEEIKSTLGDSEPNSVQKENSASGHVKVMPSDENDGNSNICVACGSPGTLRSCDGKSCQSRYHMSCLDPSLDYLSPGIWFCTSCTKKRFHFGLHSIVDGIESLWDVKEADEMQNSKQYLVKYKNLAHVHNRWVPEDDINVMPGGPDLLSLFNKRNHTEKAIWKEEWTKPQRLLRKRLLMPPKLADDFFFSSDDNYSYCTLEWLVKWKDLGYDHATWELETLPCLKTPEADKLKRNYENHREAAKQSSIPTKAKVKQSSFQKLQRLPDGCHPVFDNDHLCSINHLREFWYKSCGAVLVDDKEFVMKTILFTMSVLPDVSQPILIVTTPASLSLWEAQFNNLAPFINVVVYDGGKDELKLIQDLEFYESGSSIMLQVLLSHADAILEDIEPIARIGWEAVIVDYHQKSTLQYLEQLKQLSTDFRMLLVSSPVKADLPEYVKLLGFLSSGEQENGNCVETADALVMSELNFKRHIAYECRADSSKTLEHWVPAYISQLQLEIYCSILLSNSSVLQSKMKNDGSLCDIIMSLSKCCDHPYLVDEFLQNSPVDDGTDTIDTRVQACGKLLLLQKMLKEIRNRRLRAIVLFQSGVAGGNSVGDILEGVVRDRFGTESYSRVERGAPLARKHAAVNMFNDETKGRFVFLIESRACLPSIKLTSVDAIIMYNSDCNPLNDLKALQRINIESQYPGFFRLYTPFTMEEKQLVLAKHGVHIDNYKDMPHSLGHSLISWGAPFLFTRFDELQHDNCASKSFESDICFMDKVILEFLKKLSTNAEDSTELNCMSISEAKMSGEFYSRSIALIGESVAMPKMDGDSSTFWLHLLGGKSPCWSSISTPAQPNHKMLQNIEEPAKVPAEEAVEYRRKCRKVDGIAASEQSSDNGHEGSRTRRKVDGITASEQSSDNGHEGSRTRRKVDGITASEQLSDNSHEGRRKRRKVDGITVQSSKLMITPKNLHVRLKQELSKLIKVLQLPDNVRLMANQLFEYFLNNHLVIAKPVDILHAFNIALCWHASSLLNYKVDRRESLALAEKSFNCEYDEALAGVMYNKIRALKKKVPNRAGETSIKGQPVSVEDTQLSWQETSTNSENDHISQNKEMDLHGNFTNGASQEASSVAQQMISEGQEPVQETHKECHVPNDEPPNMIVEKNDHMSQNKEMDLHGNFTNCASQEVSSVAQQMISEGQEPVQETLKQCHVPNDEPPNMIVEKSIDLVNNVFFLREKNILGKQQLEISGLVTHRQNNVIRLKEVCSLVVEHIRRSHMDEMTRSEKIKLTAWWFTMLFYAFLEHMKLQHDKLEGLQSHTWSSERQLKEKLDQAAKLGQLDLDFDQHIALPDSNFVIEEFIHFKEQAESSVSACHLMEITLVQSEVLPEPTSVQAMENEPVETSVGSGEGPASEAVDFQENNIHCSSDGIGVQRAGCSSSTIPANDDSTGQESSTSECRNTEHIEIDNIAKSSVLLEVNANTDDTVDTDVLSCMSPQQSTDLSAQQNVAPSCCPPAEAEQTGLLGTQAVQILQPEMQPIILLSDAPPQTTHPNDRSQTGCQSDKATGPSQGGAATSHHLGDVRMQVQEKYDGNVAPDVFPESAIYPAEDSPVTVEVSAEVKCQISMQDQLTESDQEGTLDSIAAEDLQPEVQSSTAQDVPFERTCLSGMPVLQSLTIHQIVEPPLDPHAGVEPVGMVTAHDLQSEIQPSASVPAEQSTRLPAQQSLPAEVQPSTSVQDEPSEAEDEPEVEGEPEVEDETEIEDEPEVEDEPAEAERAGTFGAIAAQKMQSSTLLESPTIHQRVEPSLDPHAGVESAGTVTAHDLQSEILPSASVPMERSTSLPAQLSLATSRHSPAEAEPANILGTEAAFDLQPLQGEVQPSTTMQDQPTEGQACILGDIAARSLQPETQPSTSTQSAPFERTHLVGMPVLQSHSVEPSLDPHARVESTHTLGSLIPYDVQSEVQPSASLQDRPAEAEGSVTLGSTVAQDLQPELQSSTAVQHVPLERIHFEESRQTGFQPNMVPGPEQTTQNPPVTTLVFNNPIISDEPLKNELDRLMQCNNKLIKDHEQKKSQLLVECNQEIEKIQKKYDSLLQKEDSTYFWTQHELNALYTKVYVNKALAENFGRVFTPSSAAQGRSSMSPAMEQLPESSSAAQTAASLATSSSAIRQPAYNPVGPSYVVQPSSSRNAQPQSILPGNLYGTTSSPSLPAPAPHGSYGSAGAQSRAVRPLSALVSNLRRAVSPVPTPHLPHGSYGPASAQPRASSPHLQHQFRTPPLPYAAMHTEQQQLPANAAVTSLGQYGITGSNASAIPVGVPILNSIDPGSAHQTTSAASGSRPPRGASSLPPSSRHPAESMVSYLQSSGSNPVFMPAHQQPSYPNTVLGSSSSAPGPRPNAVPGIQQHGGVQIACVSRNQPSSVPASPGPYMPARFGLGSSSSPTDAEVVCLSDDEVGP